MRSCDSGHEEVHTKNLSTSQHFETGNGVLCDVAGGSEAGGRAASPISQILRTQKPCWRGSATSLAGPMRERQDLSNRVISVELRRVTYNAGHESNAIQNLRSRGRGKIALSNMDSLPS